MSTPSPAVTKLYAALGSEELVALLVGGREELTRPEMAEIVIQLLKHDPEGWKFDTRSGYTQVYRDTKLCLWTNPPGPIKLWTFNSTSSSLDEKPLGHWWQRWQMRRLLKSQAKVTKPKKPIVTKHYF